MACITDNREGCKGLGGTAVGYWGRSVYKRIFEEQEFARQRVLLQDQLSGAGLRANVWRGATSGVKCSCYKESNKASDRKCKSCHGVIDGYVPGYLKFGYDTFWMSASDSDVTLTNVEVTTEFKSAKVGLVSTATTGTIESADKTFTRTAVGSQWESNVVSFVRIASSSSVTSLYSLDSGSSWSDISTLAAANPVSGTIRFKVILTRTSTNVLTPYFEILRARFSTLGLSEQKADGSYLFGPWIVVLNSKPFSRYLKQDEHGDLPTVDSFTFWTAGLSMFDPSIAVNTSEELLKGPNCVIEFLDGVLAGKRFVLTSWQNSDPASYQVVSQTFTARLEDTVGPYSLLW